MDNPFVVAMAALIVLAVVVVAVAIAPLLIFIVGSIIWPIIDMFILV